MKRGTIELDTLAYWIIGILVFAIAIIGIFIMQGKGISAINYLKDLMRFGK